MKAPHWINRTALVLLHAESLAEHGGLSGMRDEGALESSLARPQQLLTYQPNADIAQLAAAYCAGIVRNHPFNDGNKRVKFLALGLFLSLNRFDLLVGQAEAAETIFRLAAGKLSEKSLADWVRKHAVRHK